MKKSVETMLGYFSQIRRVYANEINARLKDQNFSPNEISILILLSNNPSINTGNELRMVLGVSKGLVSRSLDSLAARGLIQCMKDSSDKRIQRILLTQEAAPLIDHLMEEITEMNEELLADISQEEINQMEITIRKILERFKERDGK